MNYPNSLKNLINSLKILPGVGEKTAERYAFTLLNLEDEKINDISNSNAFLPFSSAGVINKSFTLSSLEQR